MKTTGTLPTAIGLIAGLMLWGACSKQSEPNPTTEQGAQPVGTTASGLEKSLSKTAEEAKTAATTATAEVHKLAAEAAATAEAKAQDAINQAKNLVGAGKYTEAMDLLRQKLAGLQLTPEQQKLVDDLKAQIQKALTSATKDAAKAAGDVKKALGQ